jgi:FlaA1/EpsC-like NDP-sugar epimerase
MMFLQVYKIAWKCLIVAGQALTVIAAFASAWILRYDFAVLHDFTSLLIPLVIPLVLIKLVSFAITHLLSGWWKYVSIHDLLSILKGNILASMAFFLFSTYYVTGIQIPWAIYALDWVMCFLFMSGSRVVVRLYAEFVSGNIDPYNNSTKKILIIGAGASGQAIVREIRQNPRLNWRIAGYIDQDPQRQKQWFQGVQVISNLEGLSNILKGKMPDEVIIANPAVCNKKLRQIVSECNDQGIKAKIIPQAAEILNGQISIQSIRDVRLEDLLGRPSVQLDVTNIVNYIKGKNILVSGAAGSIGSELCRQAAKFGARCVILLDNSETPLFNIERQLKREFPDVRFIACLNDVRDAWQVENTFDKHNPEVVFHAAAYKHVSMSELNPFAVLTNNVLGTRVLVNAADRFHVEHFVMVSTDKAVNPTNIMGASKRLAEIYVQSKARSSKTKMVTVRFGNVLGSNGSVVPIFQEQISKGGPVTVTDPEVTRFFMTIPEAVQLVLQAGSMGEGGEIFILEMGEQIKITHLAEELIRLSGMTPFEDIDIEFTGLRPGEKLHEELLHPNEGVLPTSHKKICVANSSLHATLNIDRQLDDLLLACQSVDLLQVMLTVNRILPEYKPESSAALFTSKILRTKRPRIIQIAPKSMDVAGTI